MKAKLSVAERLRLKSLELFLDSYQQMVPRTIFTEDKLPKDSLYFKIYFSLLEVYVAHLAVLDAQSDAFKSEFRRRRLARVIKYAQKTTWWPEFFNTHGATFGDHIELEDLHALPAVARTTFLDVSKESLMPGRKTDKTLLWRKSSGSTTGTPFSWGMHKDNMIVRDAARYMSAFMERGFDFTKYRKNNFYVELNRNPEPSTGALFPFQGGYFFARRHNVDFAERVQQIATDLHKNGINVMRTAPYELEVFVEELKRQNIPAPTMPLCCFVGMDLSDKERQLAETYFNAHVFVNYGLQETGSIGIECLTHRGKYHIAPERVLIEILDEENNVVPSGQVGKVVVTSLDNITMPLIRYHTGDMGLLHTGLACTCQNKMPLLEIRNRNTEVLQLQNGATYPVNKILRRFGQEPFVSKVRRIQVCQDSLTAITVILEVRDHISLEQIEQRKKTLLPERLNMQVTFKQVSLIPQDTAKFKFFVPMQG